VLGTVRYLQLMQAEKNGSRSVKCD